MEKECEGAPPESASPATTVVEAGPAVADAAEVDPEKKARAVERYGNLLKLLMNKRDRDADDKLEEKAASSQ